MSSKTRRQFLSLTAALSASCLLRPFARAQQAVPSVANAQSPPLSWERDHPARVAWSTHLLGKVTSVFPQFEPARDIEEFFPTYSGADDKMRTAMWAELIVLIAFFESAWEPCARYHESGLGNDTVTHLPVYSEGLLQLSYQDMDVYPNLPFDWEKDKSLAPTDCTRTILDPLNNISAGVEILATQIQTYQKIVLRNHFYWSTLQDPAIGKHSRAERIKMIAARWASTAPSI